MSPKIKLRMEATRTSYAVEIPRDAVIAFSNSCRLEDSIGKLPGVSDIECNGHFGEFVYFTLDKTEDTASNRLRVLAFLLTAIREVTAQ